MSPPATTPPLGVIVVDHGSKRAESNALLLKVVDLFQHSAGYPIVEPAHMEIAEPTIDTAFDRCVARGAQLVVVHPYFLLPGRHGTEDIPRLTRQAAARHPGVRFLVTQPLGLDSLLTQLIEKRIRECLLVEGLSQRQP